MTYQETLAYLYARLPMYQRSGAKAIKKGLDRTLALCEHLGNPQLSFQSIHIAGTNGKGSVTHMLTSILYQAGFSTGMYTSPHLKDFRERIQVNGELIDPDFICSFVEENRGVIESLNPSFFEVTVAMAFSYFREKQVAYAVIETGLGGRLDSTNIITPVLSIITSIGMDHTDILGTTLEAIAGEKAGIIKPGVPVVIGEYHPETWPVFFQRAADMNASIWLAPEQYHSEVVHQDLRNQVIRLSSKEGGSVYEFTTDLTGPYQPVNLRTVWVAVELLKNSLQVTELMVRTALENVKSLTHLKGRWQVLQESPVVIADIAHNEAGFKLNVAQLLQYREPQDLIFVLGFVREKDITGILALFPKQATYYFCEPAIERKLPVEELKKKAYSMGIRGKAIPDVNQALGHALSENRQNQLIYVGGSTFVVAGLEAI